MLYTLLVLLHFVYFYFEFRNSYFVLSKNIFLSLFTEKIMLYVQNKFLLYNN